MCFHGGATAGRSFPGALFGIFVKVNHPAKPISNDVNPSQAASRGSARAADDNGPEESAMAMTTVPNTGPKTGLWTPWLTMAVVAIVAVAAGL
jgi:hypothetical protein